jgi:hypothetical protein
MGIDWKRKLASRKFWAALAALVGAVAVFCGAGESVITEVTAIISAAGVLVAYILGEAMVDSKSDDSEDGE